MAETAISIKALSKRYGSGRPLALKDLSLDVMPGEVYGFLGPNGAGKSTTIRLLMNFIQPTSGTAYIFGKDIVKDSVSIRQSIGYLSGEVALYPKLTGHEFLDYMADLHTPRQDGFVKELAKRFEANLDMKIRDLSKGNRQKIGLLQAFMHKPKVLILDEPTSGLDPLMQEEFFKLLKEATKAGGCVFVSSHNLAEVQRMCDRVGFIREGELISQQNIAEVAAAAAKTFDITFVNEVPNKELAAIPGAKVVKTGHMKLTISLRGELAPLFKVLAKAQVAGISQQEINLEEEFLRFYKKGMP
jgi:beta-exotoxin I transport system ATP-binding protein